MDDRLQATGVVLGGGLSTRMGADKAGLLLGERSLAERAVDFTLTVFAETVYVTNTPETAPRREGVLVVQDEVPHLGPLGGIAAGLKTAGYPHSFVMACDMPFVNEELVRYLVSRAAEADVVLPVTDRPQTLHAVYSRRCYDVIAAQMAAGDYRVRAFFDKVKVVRVEEAEVRHFDRDLLTFFNVNTSDDYRKAQEIAARSSEEDS